MKLCDSRVEQKDKHLDRKTLQLLGCGNGSASAEQTYRLICSDPLLQGADLQLQSLFLSVVIF